MPQAIILSHDTGHKTADDPSFTVIWLPRSKAGGRDLNYGSVRHSITCVNDEIQNRGRESRWIYKRIAVDLKNILVD